jgi:hypothetical protein
MTQFSALDPTIKLAYIESVWDASWVELKKDELGEIVSSLILQLYIMINLCTLV